MRLLRVNSSAPFPVDSRLPNGEKVMPYPNPHSSIYLHHFRGSFALYFRPEQAPSTHCVTRRWSVPCVIDSGEPEVTAVDVMSFGKVPFWSLPLAFGWSEELALESASLDQLTTRPEDTLKDISWGCSHDHDNNF